MHTQSVVAPTVELLAFGPQHLEGAVRLSQQAEWPHRREDWRLALALSQGVVAVANGTQVIGTILMTPYRNDAATINMVIVDAAQRGRGLGRELMNAALDRAGSRPLRLIATREGLPLYERLGFQAIGTVVQHQGEAPALAPPPDITPAEPGDIPALAALDRVAFGADRHALIAHLAVLGPFMVRRRDGRITGFAGLRAFGRGEVIGPVVATDAEDARSLITAAIAARPGRFVRVDTGSDTGLGPWLATLGMPAVGGGIVMQRPVIAAAPPAFVSTFALANQALG
ncbi:MAG: GNAT family N-acetyltransferase [Azospirillaceae bacterium]|nr:GNAT family N-acetyltransferase [Azospirillaceae bacterium]